MNNDDDGANAREQDRFLPIANISRLIKKALPSNAKIAKDAKETVQECVSEFISFITSEASDKCQREKRKTINGDDLLWAMQTLGFDNYIEPLRIYLAKYREQAALAKTAAGGGGGSSESVKKEALPAANVGLPVPPSPAVQQALQAQMLAGMAGVPPAFQGMFPNGMLPGVGFPQSMQHVNPGAAGAGGIGPGAAPAPQ